MNIKKTKTEDVVLLQQISIKTFLEAFEENNTVENMKNYLDSSFSIKKLLEELQNPETHFYFIFEQNNIVGYLKINFGQAQSDIKETNGMEIERIYVLKNFYGKKAGQMLYEKAMKEAKEKKVEYVWLGVWEKNTRAIRFYEKNGFEAFDKHLFKLGEDEQTDIMMKKSLILK